MLFRPRKILFVLTATSVVCPDACCPCSTGSTADRDCARHADGRSVHVRYRRTAQDSRRRRRAGAGRIHSAWHSCPNGDALVTERGARLRIVRDATGSGGAQAKLEPEPVAGLPAYPAFRGGGLQEIALHPKFATNQLVYFTYNKAGAVGQNPNQRQSAVTLARGRFDGKALTNVEELFTRRLEQRRQRIAPRIRSRRVDLHDDGRAVRREGAEAPTRYTARSCG